MIVLILDVNQNINAWAKVHRSHLSKILHEFATSVSALHDWYVPLSIISVIISFANN